MDLKDLLKFWNEPRLGKSIREKSVDDMREELEGQIKRNKELLSDIKGRESSDTHGV